MIATNNKRINDFAEKLVAAIGEIQDHAAHQAARKTDTTMIKAMKAIVIGLIRNEADKAEHQEPNIDCMMSLSTAHLDPAAKKWLSNQNIKNATAVVMQSLERAGEITTLGGTATGWFMHVPNFDGDFDEVYSWPKSLTPVLRRVHEHGCFYVLFDADADEVEGLPSYDDMGQRTDAIPDNVYWHEGNDNFYRLADGAGMGAEFHATWRHRTQEFPGPTEHGWAAGARPKQKARSTGGWAGHAAATAAAAEATKSMREVTLPPTTLNQRGDIVAAMAAAPRAILEPGPAIKHTEADRLRLEVFDRIVADIRKVFNING